MAKLSAYGRTEIFRIVQTVPKNEAGDITDYKITRVLMSDNTILEKRTFYYEQVAGQPLVYHAGHWTGIGKLKTGTSPEEWLAKRLEIGYVRI